MTEWEYRKIDLSQQRPRSDELEMLNAAGAHGWELVGITSNNIAYLKRQLEGVVPAPTAHGRAATSGQDAAANGNVEGRKSSRGKGQVSGCPDERDVVGARPHGKLAQEKTRRWRGYREVPRLV